MYLLYLDTPGASIHWTIKMRTAKFLIGTLLVTSLVVSSLVGCGDSGNRVVEETDEYSFERMSELAKQDLEQSESFEEEK